MYLVPNREAFRGEAITCLVLPARYCRRLEAIRRTEAAPTRQDRTATRRDDSASLRDTAAVIAVPASVAADRLTAAAIRDAVLRHPAGERRHRAQAVAGTTGAAVPVHRAPTEVPLVAGATADTDKFVLSSGNRRLRAAFLWHAPLQFVIAKSLREFLFPSAGLQTARRRVSRSDRS
jgi:hypothetical protein